MIEVDPDVDPVAEVATNAESPTSSTKSSSSSECAKFGTLRPGMSPPMQSTKLNGPSMKVSVAPTKLGRVLREWCFDLRGREREARNAFDEAGT